MSGGQRIDDHNSWMGKGKQYPLPEGPYKLKAERSAEGEGMVSKYEDTTEAIRATQEDGVRDIRKKPMKSGYRY